jgi:hypothetical protein
MNEIIEISVMRNAKRMTKIKLRRIALTTSQRSGFIVTHYSRFVLIFFAFINPSCVCSYVISTYIFRCAILVCDSIQSFITRVLLIIMMEPSRVESGGKKLVNLLFLLTLIFRVRKTRSTESNNSSGSRTGSHSRRR